MDEKEKISKKLRSMKKYVDFLRSRRSITREELEENCQSPTTKVVGLFREE